MLNPLELVRAPLRQGDSLEVVAHRPWPLPAGRWLMGQTWADLLFAHWRVPEAALRGLVPDDLEIDSFGGDAWVGITPLRVTGLRLRGTFPIPGLSSFPELNVRTYVRHDGRHGVFFLSLDAASGPAVAAARRFYRLPYFRARMSMQRRGARIVFSSDRSEPGSFPRTFRAAYGRSGTVFQAEPGTLEHFLTERYCLYTWESRCLYRAEIHHPPWQLQAATVDIGENTMAPRPIELEPEPEAVHFAHRQDVVVWPLERVG